MRAVDFNAVKAGLLCPAGSLCEGVFYFFDLGNLERSRHTADKFAGDRGRSNALLSRYSGSVCLKAAV